MHNLRKVRGVGSIERERERGKEEEDKETEKDLLAERKREEEEGREGWRQRTERVQNE